MTGPIFFADERLSFVSPILIAAGSGTLGNPSHSVLSGDSTIKVSLDSLAYLHVDSMPPACIDVPALCFTLMSQSWPRVLSA